MKKKSLLAMAIGTFLAVQASAQVQPRTRTDRQRNPQDTTRPPDSRGTMGSGATHTDTSRTQQTDTLRRDTNWKKNKRSGTSMKGSGTKTGTKAKGTGTKSGTKKGTRSGMDTTRTKKGTHRY